MARPSCTIVIPTRNRPTQLSRCLEALSRLDPPCSDILVVDSAPVDTQAEQISIRAKVRYVRENTPGAARARNQGARFSQAEIVAYIDDDALPEPNWLGALLKEFSNSNVMAVAGPALPPSHEDSSFAYNLFFSGGSKRRLVHQGTPEWFGKTNFGGVGIGANMAIRRRAFDVWPGFEERLGPGTLIHGCEENYAFFSLVKRGYTAVFTPHARVFHPCPLPSLAEIRIRRLQELSAATAYLTYLLVNEPNYRRHALKYLWEAAWGKHRSWRPKYTADLPKLVTRWRVCSAYAAGPALYLLRELQRLEHRIPTSIRRLIPGFESSSMQVENYIDSGGPERPPERRAV